jgi:predicted DNA-binding transcriptional regulator YafY
MGQKTAGESIAAIIQAFLKRRTWSQAELARQVDLHVPALRKRILDLRSAGMPLVDEKDHPHIYWSVPKNWFPGGVALEGKDVEVLLRLLGRMPKSRERDRLIKLTLESLPGNVVAGPASDAVMTRETSDPEERFLDAVEDAARRKKPLRFRYYSASRGSDTWRHASVHRVVVGPPARFVAICHRDDKLKWFRIDNVVDAAVDAEVEWKAARTADVDDLVASSLDGFHDSSAKKERHTFFVREPEARWVAKNLLEGMKAEEARKGGIRVAAVTTAVNRLARYVVGLGDAAHAETKALREEVLRIARGAAAANQAGDRES